MKDLTGEKFGRLFVIKESDKRIGDRPTWLCRCDCGNTKEVSSQDLTTGRISSCGCLKRGRISHKDRKLIPTKSLPNINESPRINTKFSIYRSSARNRGLEFELSKEDFLNLITGECTYCGKKSETGFDLKSLSVHTTFLGIDRVDNTKGYTINNVVSCCKLCNRMKMTLTKDEFLEQIARIYNHLSNK